MDNKKDLKLDSLNHLSKTKRNQIYGSIISAVASYLEERLNSSERFSYESEGMKIEYFGDVLDGEKFEIKESKEGEKYYSY